MKTSETQENLENVTEEETEQVVVQHHRLGAVMPIILFSYIGVLIRLGLAFLGNSQTPLNAAFWPNFVGCLIIGFVVEQKIHIQKKYVFIFCLRYLNTN
jgi:Na+/glutamate symporter